MSDHEAIIVRLDAIHEVMCKVESRVAIQNGRVATCEAAIAVLRWALFGGGTLTLGALWYLIQMHFVK